MKSEEYRRGWAEAMFYFVAASEQVHIKLQEALGLSLEQLSSIKDRMEEEHGDLGPSDAEFACDKFVDAVIEAASVYNE